MALAERRLRWLEARQGVLAQNIANADTPGYRARDLRPFSEALAAAGGTAPARTDRRHLGPVGGTDSRAVPDRRAVERTPDGNGVALDVQAMRVADTETAHALAVSLRQRYLGFFRAALGRAQ